MPEEESVMVVPCELKIPSLGITVRRHSASLVMPNSCPRDGIFNPQITTITDPYIYLCSLSSFLLFWYHLFGLDPKCF